MRIERIGLRIQVYIEFYKWCHKIQLAGMLERETKKRSTSNGLYSLAHVLHHSPLLTFIFNT